jgi:hypothetical protein
MRSAYTQIPRSLTYSIRVFLPPLAIYGVVNSVIPLSLRFDSVSSKSGQLEVCINPPTPQPPPSFFSHAETHYYCILIAHLFNINLQ